MALDVSQGEENRNMLILWDRHGEANQRFRFKPIYGKYAIFSTNGATIEVPNGATDDGVQIYVNYPNNTPNEHWDIQPAPGR